jgi:hypothetical protein
VFNDIQATRSDKASEKMVIKREVIDTGHIGIEECREPDILGDNLSSGLDAHTTARHGVRDAPASSTASTRLLRDCERNTGLQCAGHVCALPVSGATRYTKALGVDASLPDGLEDVSEKHR